jgi:hypothetical protein
VNEGGRLKVEGRRWNGEGRRLKREHEFRLRISAFGKWLSTSQIEYKHRHCNRRITN